MGRTGADPAARGLGTRPVLSPRRRNRDPAAERRGAPAPSLAPRRNRAMTGGLAVALFGLTALALTIAILLLPVVAVMLYGRLGSPSLPDQPFAARTAAGTQSATANPAAIDM